MALSVAEARARLEAAQAESQWPEGQRLAQEALEVAGGELAAARRAADSTKKLAALEVVVRSQLFLGDFFAASLAASDEIAMIAKSGDKAGEAAAQQLLSEVQAARGDVVGAASSIEAAVALLKDLGDKPALAKASCLLSGALLAAGKKNLALAPAQESLKLYEELGDREGEGSARRAVNVVFAEKGMLDKAPGRAAAQQALQDLTRAAEDRNAQRWAGAMEELNRNGAYVQKDIDSAMESALEKDRSSTAAFLEEQGVAVKGAGTAQLQISELMKPVQYLQFRVGGLGYGPRFRCGHSFKKQVGDDIGTLSALACLQVADEADDWEGELQFHPGVLDSMLQSGMAMG